jgi:hypothetical protein
MISTFFNNEKNKIHLILSQLDCELICETAKLRSEKLRCWKFYNL